MFEGPLQITTFDDFAPMDYQDRSIRFAVGYKQTMVAARMGLGKTAIGMWTLEHLLATNEIKSCILIVTKRAYTSWRRHGLKYWPTIWSRFVHIMGTPSERMSQWKQAPRFVVTTYHMLQRDFPVLVKLGASLSNRILQFDFAMTDEGHKYYRGHTTKTFKILKPIMRGTKYQLHLTGTPASRGAQHFWTYLHLMDPKLFPSYWKYVHMFCQVVHNGFGQDIVGNRNVESWRKMSKQRILFWDKDIAKGPPKRRSLVPVTMSPKIEKVYDQLRDQMWAEIEKDSEHNGIIFVSNPLTKLLRLRQLLICPQLVDPDLPDSASLEYIMETLDEAEPEDRHIVIFTPYTQAIPYIKRRLESSGLVTDVQTLQGGLSPDELDQRINTFKKKRGVIISGIAYAESFELETSSLCFFMGQEYDQEMNEQAEDRLHRPLIITHTVNCYYLYHEDTVEEPIVDNLIQKKTNVMTLLGTKAEMRRLLGIQ